MVDEEDVVLVWYRSLSTLGEITPQTAFSLEHYHQMVGAFDAYVTALEIIENVALPSRRGGQRMLKTPVRLAFHRSIQEAMKAQDKAPTTLEKWQAVAREATLRTILADWLAR